MSKNESEVATSGLSQVEEMEGVGPKMAEKCGAAGVKNTADLLESAGTRKGREALAESIAAKLAEVNAEKELTRGVPSAKSVQGWVDDSKGIEPAISH